MFIGNVTAHALELFFVFFRTLKKDEVVWIGEKVILPYMGKLGSIGHCMTRMRDGTLVWTGGLNENGFVKEGHVLIDVDGVIQNYLEVYARKCVMERDMEREGNGNGHGQRNGGRKGKGKGKGQGGQRGDGGGGGGGGGGKKKGKSKGKGFQQKKKKGKGGQKKVQGPGPGMQGHGQGKGKGKESGDSLESALTVRIKGNEVVTRDFGNLKRLSAIEMEEGKGFNENWRVSIKTCRECGLMEIHDVYWKCDCTRT